MVRMSAPSIHPGSHVSIPRASRCVQDFSSEPPDWLLKTSEGVVVQAFNPRRQRQVAEFKVLLVYIVSSRLPRNT